VPLKRLAGHPRQEANKNPRRGEGFRYPVVSESLGADRRVFVFTTFNSDDEASGRSSSQQDDEDGACTTFLTETFFIGNDSGIARNKGCSSRQRGSRDKPGGDSASNNLLDKES